MTTPQDTASCVIGQPKAQRPPTPPRRPCRDDLPRPQTEDDVGLHVVFRYTPIPTIVLDSDLFIRQVSDSYVEVSEGACMRERVVGLHAYDFFDQQKNKISSQDARKAFQIAIETRRPYQLLHAVGLVTWNIRIVPIFRHDSLRFIQMELLDVTEERKRQKELEDRLDANENFRILVETVKDYAIFMLDPQGLVATWNAGAQCFKGYTRDEIIGQHFSKFYGEEDLANRKPETALKVALAEGRNEDEGWRCRKDGSRFWANVVITPIYRGDTLLGFSKVTRDLSERRNAEAGIITAYEEASKLKSDFLANMSHEIRTPMHGSSKVLKCISRCLLSYRYANGPYFAPRHAPRR